MRKIFEIDRSRLLALVRRELEQAETFNRNIRGAAERFAAHLERAAVMLELAGCFDAENETADCATLSRKLNELANREGDQHEEA